MMMEEFVMNLLICKKQIILYGPPGTGKTYNAIKIAVNLIESTNRRKDKMMVEIPASEGNENIVKIVNYSPNKHLNPCSYEQKIENKTCYERERCLREYGEYGCRSSEALAPEIGAHYLRQKNPKNVVKNRCFFLVSKHPNKKLYFSGVIFITNSCEADPESNDKGWVVGEPIPFEPQTVEWRGKLKRGGAEKWISNKEALEILEAYYSKVKDKKVAEIIKFYKKGEIPDFVTDSRSCPPL